MDGHLYLQQQQQQQQQSVHVMRIRRNHPKHGNCFHYLSRNPLLRCLHQPHQQQQQQQRNVMTYIQSICILIIIAGFIYMNQIQYSRLSVSRTSSSKKEMLGRLQRLRVGLGVSIGNRKTLGNNDTTATTTGRGNTMTLTRTTKLREQWIEEDIVKPFNENNVATSATHLIVVAGHSVTISGHLEDANVDEHDWYLLPYQKGHGLPDAIIGHISAGIIQAAIDPVSLLIFSGGQTRSITGPESEGSSYYRVADAMQLWSRPFLTTSSTTNQDQDQLQQLSTNDINTNGTIVALDTMTSQQQQQQQIQEQYPGWETVRARTVTEEFATDSFENLLFSICRFYEITGKYPTSITVVSFTFKERRFRTLHIPALQYPILQFNYIGYNPPSETGFNLTESTQGELENAAKPFEQDPYGCNTPTLQIKRKERNPFHRTHPYDTSCPDMYELLHYCGPDIISKDKVPW